MAGVIDKILKNKFKLVLFLLFIIGFFLRVYKLESVPLGFHDDELDAGYIGRYILLHGKDIKGNYLPFYYDKLDDFRPAGIFYLSGISTFIFGTNEFAVRFPSAFFGALTVLAIYFFGLELTKNRYVALTSSFLLSLSPWHIELSRATSESVIGLFFALLGLTLFIKGFSSKSAKLMLSSFFPLIIAYFFYHSFRLLIPLFLFPFIFVKIQSAKKIKFLVIFSFCLFLFVTAGIGMTKWGRGRFSQVAFYLNPSISNTIDKQIFADGPGVGLNIIKTRFFHNKVIIYTREFLKQYLGYFSPSFIFLEGGLPERYKVPESGLFFFTEAFMIFLGLLLLFVDKGRKFGKYYILYLLFTAPFAAALTFEDVPNVQRSIFLVIPLILIAAFGFSFINKVKTKHKLLTISVLFCLFFEFILFFHQYMVHSPSYKSLLRKEGNREVVKAIINRRNSYNKVVMARAYDIGLYYLFFSNNFNPLPAGSVKYDNTIESADNVLFTREECPSKEINKYEQLFQTKKILIVDDTNCPFDTTTFDFIDEIVRKDSTQAFRLLTPIEPNPIFMLR